MYMKEVFASVVPNNHLPGTPNSLLYNARNLVKSQQMLLWVGGCLSVVSSWLHNFELALGSSHCRDLSLLPLIQIPEYDGHF